MHVGIAVNPVAGMGGRVGLKGTDGKVAEAVERGAEPRAPDRARRTLDRLAAVAPDAAVSVAADPMGESVVREAGFDPVRVVDPFGGETPEPTGTTAAHTAAVVRAFAGVGGEDGVEASDGDPVDLVLFVGGDGTAADVAEALEGTDVPMLGVPAGVKVYSSVFAVSPEDAAEVAASFSRTERREVMDIDEDAYREGEVNPTLRGVAHVPVADDLQSSKQTASGTVESLAEGVAADVRERDGEGVTFVLGPGSTVGAIKDELGFEPSPIGVDVWRDGEVIVRDATEAAILDALGEENVVVVSPIGGQGFVFGRGNPQISPAVIRRCDLRIVASRAKLDGVRALRVDTDDPDLDAELAGWVRVRVGKFETRMMKIV
ncbi:N-acetylglucosamine-1-phosphate uridyltransferase [Halorubrum sp. SP3]|uniref:ATP-NAD kinase family protein n=1 Tax=unclassified Halorubrum TaxID=2642239 RepID=UPI0010F58ABA|nr:MULTISPECIES: ATP-NAD kinase family protein [unclassified Halorubrum]TKX54557.1 N-acetylglucosamine-1-phosphate uridyltransferase [Halorubrum sp. SP3]TKX66942.1 N-acetylglucosamine-1-phosphate uridyltransferase [Halorubrum sp. SP9]